jgi:hypothetical protein
MHHQQTPFVEHGGPQHLYSLHGKDFGKYFSGEFSSSTAVDTETLFSNGVWEGQYEISGFCICYDM